MQKNNILVGVVVYNEDEKLPILLKKIHKVMQTKKFYFLFVNDNSTDKSAQILKKFIESHVSCSLINHKKNSGVGKSIKNIITFGLKNNFLICVIMAGNGKDDPLEISKIITPITSKNYDYVQGSRFLHGGSFDNLPILRKLMIKGFTFIFYFFTGYAQTDTSNGFRAYKLDIFKDKEININQNWLNRYELETYLHYKVITLSYKICEIPVSKNYLHGIKKYSKIKPVIDWWRILSPLIYLKLKLKN